MDRDHQSDSSSQGPSSRGSSKLHLPDLGTVKDAVRKIASHDSVHTIGGAGGRHHVSFSHEPVDSARDLLVENVEQEEDAARTMPRSRSVGFGRAAMEEGIQCDFEEDHKEAVDKPRHGHTNYSFTPDNDENETETDQCLLYGPYVAPRPNIIPLTTKSSNKPKANSTSEVTPWSPMCTIHRTTTTP
ncbi:hypothetical protein BV898_15604 [Hypsibius exemplaris]|uniref:Uncharacterized protein n=1 Tax=Hypsibius exemplaris TaxID=2072580 RepID=A0A9X6NBE3_HYPEX|nr:hypothetical protein BV898_15604 [Hypsibius exemplaris]